MPYGDDDEDDALLGTNSQHLFKEQTGMSIAHL